jgi:hypothetical protein
MLFLGHENRYSPAIGWRVIARLRVLGKMRGFDGICKKTRRGWRIERRRRGPLGNS